MPAPYKDHHTVAIGRRSTLALPHVTPLLQPAWIAGEPRDPQIDSYPFPSGPTAYSERQAIQRNQSRNQKQPLPISPMRTPSSKVPPQFEWSSEYDCWQKEAERSRTSKRMEDTIGTIRESVDVGDLEWGDNTRRLVGNKRLAGESHWSRHMREERNKLVKPDSTS